MLQGDEDLAVRRRDERTLAQGEVQTAVGDADVVEEVLDLVGRNHLPDRVLDLHEFPLRLFDARAGHAADVELDEARVDGREEILPDEWQEQEGSSGEEGEADHEVATVLEGRGEERSVPAAQPLEAALETLDEAGG